MAESDMKPTAEWQRDSTIKSLLEQWGPTTLLDGLDENDQGELVLWYDNQYRANKLFTAEDDRYDQFRRLSIPLTRRVYCGLHARKFVSVRTMIGPTDLMQVWKDNKISEHTFSACTRRMGITWTIPKKLDTDGEWGCPNGIKNLDAEAEMCAIMALDVAMETDREVTRDLTNNAQVSTVDCSDPKLWSVKEVSQALCNEVERVGVDIVDRTGIKGQLWAVTSPEVFALIQLGGSTLDEEPNYNSFGLSYRQKYGDVKFYVDPMYPTSTILVGLKAEDPRVSGYYYNPYVLTPIFKTKIENEEAFAYSTDTERYSLMSRFSKHMVPSGSKFYQRINLMNFLA
jgi:hypothetical protein